MFFSSVVPQWLWVLEEEYQTNSFQSLLNICVGISLYNFWHRWDLGENPCLMDLTKLPSDSEKEGYPMLYNFISNLI